jgi:hypothetical protein
MLLRTAVNSTCGAEHVEQVATQKQSVCLLNCQLCSEAMAYQCLVAARVCKNDVGAPLVSVPPIIDRQSDRRIENGISHDSRRLLDVHRHHKF